MNAVVTQALPHWAVTWGTAILIFGGGWVILSFLFMASTNDSEHWGMRGWLGWGAFSAVVVALGVGFFVLPDKQDVVEYSDAKSYVASETGQELESKYSDGPFGSSSPSLSIDREDRKSTRLNSSHVSISYAVFCLKKKNMQNGGPYASHRET